MLPRVPVCSLSPCAVCSAAAAVKFDLLLCWNATCPVRQMQTNKRCGLLSLPKPDTPHHHHHFETQNVIFRNFSCCLAGFVMKPLYFKRQRLAENKPDLVCLWLYWTRVQSGVALRRNVEMESSEAKRQRCISERDSCCTCQRPFVQLSLHSGADAPHTPAGVKRCQVHLRPPAAKGHRLTDSASDRRPLLSRQSRERKLQQDSDATL